MTRRLLALATALALAGCTMIPKYSRPAAPVPPAFSAPPQGLPPAAPAPAAAPAAAPDLAWQDFLADPRLRGVVTLALDNNRDLRVAALNVERAQAAYRIERSFLYPTVGVLGDVARTRIPENLNDGTAKTTTQYSVNLGVAAWELDLFGRLRSLKAAALNQYLATEQASHAARSSLIAAVAASWLALAADLEALDLARSTVAAQQDSAELIRQSRDLGVASDLDYQQARSQVEAARADMARLTGDVEVDRHTLDLLAGAPVPPALLPEELGTVSVATLAAGVPSEVLLRRPDVAAAEFQLLAANADIGAARAAFFPRISLTAAVGTASRELSGLFGSGTGTWTFAPQIVAPIFTGGLNRANLKGAQVTRDIAVAQYERSIQIAFAEVSDSLSLRTTLVDQRAALESLVDALQQSYTLSEARYQAGIDSHLQVLVAQRALFTAQESLVRVRLGEQVNLVTLYKVLGGGATGTGGTPIASTLSAGPGSAGAQQR